MEINQTENKWMIAVLNPSYQVDVYAFPAEENRKRFIEDLPPGLVFATAFDDGTPDLFAGFFEHVRELIKNSKG